MTSKRIKKKKKKTSRLLLFCCCLKIERKNYIQKQTISKTHDEFFLGGYLYKKRERERNKTRRWMSLVHFTSLSRAKSEKKIRFHVKRKHNKQQAKRKKTTKQTDDWLLLLKTEETLYTHFGGFIHSQEKQYSCSLFFFVQEEIRGVFSRRRF